MIRQTIGTDPNIVEEGMALAVPSLCGSTAVVAQNLVYDHGPRPFAIGSMRDNRYTVAWGGCVFMHDGGGGRSQTLDALQTILPNLQQQGYQFRTVFLP